MALKHMLVSYTNKKGCNLDSMRGVNRVVFAESPVPAYPTTATYHPDPGFCSSDGMCVPTHEGKEEEGLHLQVS